MSTRSWRWRTSVKSSGLWRLIWRKSLEMNDGSELNFAGRLIRRLGPNSQLINAPDGETVAAAEIQDSVKNAAAALLSAGLQAGDRVLISCGLGPASTLAYLGALYA